MTQDSWTSLPQMFFTQAERQGDAPFLWRKRKDGWEPHSWAQVAGAVQRLASGLRALGLTAGDRVLLVSENRPEWLIADFAIMSAGGVTVPAYTTNLPADHLHLLNNAGVRLVIVSTKALAQRVIAAGLQADHPPQVICIEAPELAQDPGLTLLRWEDVLALGQAGDPAVQAVVRSGTRTDLACIIYTSGTGGAPKGVMLSHGAILSNCFGAETLLRSFGLKDEVFLSFLPLSHSYEHTAGQCFPISIGAQIYYADSVDTLAATMAEIRPTIMTAVPRLYEMMRGKILKGVERQGGLSEKLFRRTLELGRLALEQPQAMTLGQRLLNLLLTRLVRRKVALRFGGRLKALVSGGAPLNYEVGMFFAALGVPILQGYGQTESAPIISCNPPGRAKVRTVGPVMAGVEMKLAGDGEILVRGELVMQGYWNDPDSTRAALQDGWLHTGDIGTLDDDGYLMITDRKKDLIVNSGGDNIAPQRVEGFLTLQPEIAQAMVYGDRRPHLVALIVPDGEFVKQWVARQSFALPDDFAGQIRDNAFRKMMAEVVERVNRGLSPIEKIRRFELLAEPFSTQNGQLTPTLKIRRHAIVTVYDPVIRGMYEERRSRG